MAVWNSSFVFTLSSPSMLTDLRAPTFCIDPEVFTIVRRRASLCLHGGSAMTEFQKLRLLSVVDFHRSHELMAYNYFVEFRDNPHRRKCDRADFEFIPLLPLAWMSEFPTSTYCTAGGYCPHLQRDRNISTTCSVGSLIADITSIVKHIKVTRHQAMDAGIPKFTVASTFNLRTFMGFGLPSIVRSGPVYTAVTSFVTSIHLGHYERQHQCPDVLRKGWKSLTELPMISLRDPSTTISSSTPPISSSSSSSSSAAAAAGTMMTSEQARPRLLLSKSNGARSRDEALAIPPQSLHHSQTVGTTSTTAAAGNKGGEGEGGERPITFFFSGRLLLWLPERVCSVRHTVATALAYRTDTLILNITDAQSYSGINHTPLEYMQKSVFCLITRSDSYSSASFYEALQAGCIPIVISDWFVFAFPWFVPYEKFVIRLDEGDFLKDPNMLLDNVKGYYHNSDSGSDNDRGSGSSSSGSNRSSGTSGSNSNSNSNSGSSSNRVEKMRQEMRHWRRYLTYQYQRVQTVITPGINTPVTVTTAEGVHQTAFLTTSVPDSIDSTGGGLSSPNVINQTASVYSILPFELMLREMKRNQDDILATAAVKANKAATAKAANQQKTTAKSKLQPTAPVYEDRYCYNPGMCTTRVAAFKTTTTTTTTSHFISSSSPKQPPKPPLHQLQQSHQQQPLVDRRSHLCKHASRLMGHSKIVFFMQCVRMLWPLTPGKLSPKDTAPGALTADDIAFIRTFHNVSKNTTKDWYSSWITYPIIGNEKFLTGRNIGSKSNIIQMK